MNSTLNTNCAKILIVEDEAHIQELLEYNLTKEGYRLTCVKDGEQALRSIKASRPDLVILDLMLPGINGLEVCKFIKSNALTASIPVIMLTAKGEEVDVVTGLELGADDYIAKPFSIRVLIARVRAALRKTAKPKNDIGEIVEFDDIRIDTGKHEVKLDNDNLDLTPTEFGILLYLTRKRGYVASRYQIVEAVHGSDYPVTDRSVDVQIASLRKKLGSYGQYIETVRGVGYRVRE